MPARGGKPKLPPELKRSEWVNFRVTPGEKDAVCRAAVQAGSSEGDLLMARAGFRETETPEPFHEDGSGATLRGER